MASEEDLAGSGTSSPAASTSQVSRAARPGASENLRCPICRAAINDRASVSWRWHPFCFYCMVEWFHRRVKGLICQSPSPDAVHMVEDSNSEVHSIRVSISSASHTQGGRAGSCSAERCQHHSSGCQHRRSYSRSCGGREGSRGGSRGRAQNYSNSSSRRRWQSRARSSARDRARTPRTKQQARAVSRRRRCRQQEFQVSFIEPRAVRSRSRQRSRSSASRTLREYLRKMERDEGRALRHDWYIRASSRRSGCQQQRSQISYREPQVTRSRTPGRFCSTMPLKENPRRMERYERQPLTTEQGIHASPRRSERLQQRRQASFTEPPVTRSQSWGRSCRTRLQTLHENLRRMERDEGRALRPKRDIPSSSGWSERGRRISFTKP